MKKENQTEESQEPVLTLSIDEINFFLRKVDAFKLFDRICKHYNITDTNEFKELFELPNDAILSEVYLKRMYKENNIPNIILTPNEIKVLKDLFLTEHIKELENKVKKAERRKENKKSAIKQFLLIANNGIETYPKNIASISDINKFFSWQSQAQSFLMHSDLLSSEDYFLLQSTHIKLNELTMKISEEGKDAVLRQILKNQSNIPVSSGFIEYQGKTPKHKSNANLSSILSLEYQERMREYNLKQEQELLERIHNRKNGITEDSNNLSSKDESIIIEAYSEDFNSEKSRFVLSVLHGNNIKISFYNGVIKLKNEDDSFCRVDFSTLHNNITFVVDGYSDKIDLNLNLDDKIIDLISAQTSSKSLTDKILDCLSVLYYINTFYNEKEKIEIHYDEAVNTPVQNDYKNKSDNKSISTIYLTKQENKRIKTIKIRKGKRSISGTFLTRGHWRRQKYLDGVKIIWIDPFWKGKGKVKQKLYKINN